MTASTGTLNSTTPPRTAPTYAKVLLVLLAAKLYAVGLLYLQFSRTELTDDYRAFVFVPEGSSRHEELKRASDEFPFRLTPWDGQWYLDVAANGYTVSSRPPRRESDAKQGNFAFFPLLPALLRVLDATFPGPVVPALALNVILSTLALALLWRECAGLGVQPWIVCALLIAFPSALFQYVLYTEGIFLFLSICYWVLLRRRQLLAAAVVGYLGALCRPQGILLVFLALEFVLPRLASVKKSTVTHRSALRWMPLLSPALGLTTVMLLNAQATGSPWSFLEIQMHWGRHVDLGAVFRSMAEFLDQTAALPDLGATVFGIILLPLVWRYLPPSLALYATASVLMPLSTGRVLSMGRFMSVCFPHFLALAMALDRHRRIAWGVVAFFALFQLLLSKPLMAWQFVG